MFRRPTSTGYPRPSTWANHLEENTFRMRESSDFMYNFGENVSNCIKHLSVYILAVIDMLTAEINKLPDNQRKSIDKLRP